MKRIISKSVVYILFIGFVAAWNSCEKDDPVPTVEITAKVEFTELAEGSTTEGLKIRVKNNVAGVSREFTTDSDGEVVITLEEGVYNFEVTGTIIYTYTDYDEGNEQTKSEQIAGLVENVSVSSAATNKTVSITAFLSGNTSGWVIKELYSAGTKTTTGNANYNKVQFVEIYNNSDGVLYADGLAIGETRAISTSETNIYADDMSDYTFVWTLYSIPGNGTTYPVEPGKSILIAPYPINHPAEFDPVDNKLLDLSGADFQWYDEHRLALQVPEVPDLIKHYSYSASIWIVAVQTNRGFVLFKTDNIEEYVENNMDHRNNSAGTSSVATVRLDNSKVLDAVDLGQPDNIKVKTLSPALDLGLTYCSDTYNGKSVRRKVSHVEADGRVVYQDTNNSTIDFIPDADPQPRQFNVN